MYIPGTPDYSREGEKRSTGLFAGLTSQDGELRTTKEGGKRYREKDGDHQKASYLLWMRKAVSGRHEDGEVPGRRWRLCLVLLSLRNLRRCITGTGLW